MTHKQSNSPFLRLSYTSQCSEGKIIPHELTQEILKVAQIKNKELGITGVLICVKNMFFQILEGGTNEVKALFETIKRDSRNVDVTCLEKNPFFEESERQFPDWQMKLLDVEHMQEEITLKKAFGAFTSLLSSVLKNHRIIERYTQPAIGYMVKNGENPLLVAPVQVEIVIMFVDLCNFTTISEILNDSLLLVDMLNKFFECVMDVVSEYGGEVTKLIGDCAIIYTFLMTCLTKQLVADW